MNRGNFVAYEVLGSMRSASKGKDLGSLRSASKKESQTVKAKT